MDEPTQVIVADEWPAEDEVVSLNGRPEASLLASLRARRAAIAIEHHYDLEVPGWDGCLVLRLEPLRGQELSLLARRAEASKDPDREFNTNADIIIRACRQVLGRENRSEQLRTVHPDEVTPVTLGEFRELMGFETASARELLLQLFEVPSPEIAIGLKAGEFVLWSSEAAKEDEEEFQGELPAAPR